jgi:hypothetical protein
MASGNFAAQGMNTYSRCLTSAREKQTVGIGLHIRTPQPPESRIGFVGKSVARKERKELVERLWQSALKNPSLMPAALNAMRVWESTGK